jgi:hypothetical protein
MRFSTSGFFMNQFPPSFLSIPIRPFQFFSKILGDVCSSRCTTGVVDSGGRWKKSAIIKVLIIIFGHFTHRYIYSFRFTSR